MNDQGAGYDVSSHIHMSSHNDKGEDCITKKLLVSKLSSRSYYRFSCLFQ